MVRLKGGANVQGSFALEFQFLNGSIKRVEVLVQQEQQIISIP